MALTDALVAGLHVTFAGLWTGSVLFVTFAVVPTALDGRIDSQPLSAITDRFKLITRASVLVTLLTGAHQATTGYTVDSLLSSPRGHLVVTMVVLWLVLAGLSEVGAAKLTNGTQQRKVRTPATQARPFFLAASLVAILLLLDAGALGAPW
ncbi:transporter [Halorhabdus sp. CBA1104]|uniref:CopD family protein n=1 Tax=unclassified Halorhabdus TaxID=2621901 RepID=UPI0012B2722A|nr:MULTISPECIES: CopD family protein [unclassified Halorhabdus]QGN07152.1 transporter [Halorhabdus sp. CBA1104]